MRKILYIFCLSLLLTSCDDGDILEIELDFEDDLTLCDQFEDEYSLYKIKADPYESLSIVFPSNTNNDQIFNPPTDEIPFEGTITGSVRFIYRTYDGNPENLFCTLVPGSDVNIISDNESESIDIDFTSTFEDSDGDGIPSEFEDLNGNGNYDDDDFDGDGIPNYIDQDDDNDNVLTINENHNFSTEDGLANAVNTDNDTYDHDNDPTTPEIPLPNYLDNDDDGDGVLTRYEDENMDKNPTNDFAIDATIARYLDADAADTYVVDEFIDNTYTRTVTTNFEINDPFNLGALSMDYYFFGTYETTITFPEED